jgi:hypothetical protein
MRRLQSSRYQHKIDRYSVEGRVENTKPWLRDQLVTTSKVAVAMEPSRAMRCAIVWCAVATVFGRGVAMRRASLEEKNDGKAATWESQQKNKQGKARAVPKCPVRRSECDQNVQSTSYGTCFDGFRWPGGALAIFAMRAVTR